jgi:hypothetical protein
MSECEVWGTIHFKLEDRSLHSVCSTCDPQYETAVRQNACGAVVPRRLSYRSSPPSSVQSRAWNATAHRYRPETVA